MSKKKTEKLTYDLRAKLTADFERDAATTRAAALEAQIAALQAPPPAAPAPPVVDVREARRAELKAQADALPEYQRRAFVCANAFEILPLEAQNSVMLARGIAPPPKSAA